ncbi:hypothetical protein B5G20_05150 [Collinsella sp. An7]|nr:hypothetical protein B5G20_05150 [Collinsella sp. An7]
MALGRELMQHFDQTEQDCTCLHPTDSALQRQLARLAIKGEVTRVVDGLYARTVYWSSLRPDEQAFHLMRALQVVHPSWVFCHESAALVYGLPVSYHRMLPVKVSCGRRDSSGTRRGAYHHAVPIDDAEVVQGLRVTPLPRTLCDCIASASFADALAYADGAIRVTSLSVERLGDAVRALNPRPHHAERVLDVLTHADGRSESWAESAMRALVIERGFALPDLQVEFPRPLDPNRTFRADMVFTRRNGTRVITEIDGIEKYVNERMLGGRSTARTLADEQHREAQLTLLGMPIMRVSAEELRQPERVVRKLIAYDIPRRAA